MTALKVSFSQDGLGFTATRAVTGRIDLTIKTTTASGFALSGRWEVLDYLEVFTAGLDLSRDGFSILVGLFLGPVRLDWGRRFGSSGARWGILTVSHPGVSVSFGAYWQGSLAFYGGIILFHEMRYVSLLAHGQRIILSLGGLF